MGELLDDVWLELEPEMYVMKYKLVLERALSEPIFVEAPSNVTKVVGETIELRVQIFSDPEYSLSWVKHMTGSNVTGVEVLSFLIYCVTPVEFGN